ncbi:unnamed protein product [Schistosoma bovis]|nr:unnamed protein product [Schistosoma bovis]
MSFLKLLCSSFIKILVYVIIICCGYLRQTIFAKNNDHGKRHASNLPLSYLLHHDPYHIDFFCVFELTLRIKSYPNYWTAAK